MIGLAYWTSGVKLTPHPGGGWGVGLEFLDNGWCELASTEGTLHCRYLVPTEELAQAINTLLMDADRLGIITAPSQTKKALYMAGDGAADYPYPSNWRELGKSLARDLYLEWPYKTAPAEDCDGEEMDEWLTRLPVSATSGGQL